MINELQMLGQSLEKNGISVPVKHPWIEGIKKGEALLVNVTGDGDVDSLEFCSQEQVKTYWNIKESNKATFPKINVDPLWGAEKNEELLKSISKAGKQESWDVWFQGVHNLLSSSTGISCKETPEKILNWKKDKWSRLYAFPHESILPRLSDGNNELAELIHCFDSYELFDVGAMDQLFVQIAEMLVENLKNGRMDCFKFAQYLLVGKPDAKQQSQVTLIFNHSKNKVLVSDQDEVSALGRALSLSTDGKTDYLCPLSGKMEDGAIEKFPSPKLPMIGNSYLMAMNKDALCHKRYGKIGTHIFPASTSATSHLDNVMRYITSEDRKLKTWMSVASGKWEGRPKKEVRDLLICYTEEMPALQNEGLAFMLGGDSDTGAMQQQRFESISSLVCDALHKNKMSETGSQIRIFVIRKISKGQSQVVLNDFCSFTDLVGAVEIWNKAAKNHPSYALWLPVKKGEKAVKTEPPVPFPADLLRLLQHQWIRDGMESSKLDGCSLVSAYDLFFDRGGRTQVIAKQVLSMILQRTKPLLIGAGKAIDSMEYSVLTKKSILQAISFLGIILFKLGYTMEEYMKSAGYNIGRLLSLVDCLHREYCRHVRNGDIPNNLLGNSLLQTVLDNPVRGLARLSERIAVYSAPFDRLHGEEYKLAGWAKKQMGIVSETLAGVELPSSTDDILKAQILLGYLAQSESKQ